MAIKISQVPYDQIGGLLQECVVQYFCQHKNLVKLEALALEDLPEENSIKLYFVMELMKYDLR
jgi:hypothetical protein